MSCFSGTVSRVANTRIFARPSHDGAQVLVYQMEYAADSDLALILPLPTPTDSATDAVRFIDLSGYPGFFSDMDKGFPFTRGPAYPGDSKPASPGIPPPGRFDASFVPNLQGFSNLDERYRIPESVWNQLPEYNGFGFAVFKLSAGAHTIPPIAIEFPVRNPHLLYFPTVHIHDGTAPAEANFDHDLFCQARAGWLRSYDVASSFMDTARAQGVLDPSERVSRMTVQGLHPNSDVIVGLRA